MAPRVIPGSIQLGASIKQRRISLGLSIAEAATKAGVGEKSWGRYEAGGSIRMDKARAVCRALGWPESQLQTQDLPDSRQLDLPNSYDIDAEQTCWSPFLNEVYGRRAAMGFAIGSDSLLDEMSQALEDLGRMPRGTHIGELGFSFLGSILPEQFLMRYDYDFFYMARARLHCLQERLHTCTVFQVHMPIDELLLSLSLTEATPMEDWAPEVGPDDDTLLDDSLSWEEYSDEVIGGLCGDNDYELMYNERLVPHWLCYHFDNWFMHVFNSEDPDPWDGLLENE